MESRHGTKGEKQMIDKKEVEWTEEDDKAVRQYKKDVKSGKIKPVSFDLVAEDKYENIKGEK